MTTRLSFPLENISPLGSDKRFAALERQFTQRPGRAYLSFTFHGTAPLVNRKGMSITYPTHKNSVESAIDALVDYEHEAEDLPTGASRTNQVGHICALYIDDTDLDNMGWFIQDVIPRQSVLTRGVMALQTRIRSVNEIVDEIRSKRENWFFSLEIGEDVPPPEIWVFDDNEHNIMSWDEAPEDLRSAASQPQEVTWQDKKVAYLMGGRNGIIPYIGGAVTRYPAGREQDAVPGNQLKFICSWTGDGGEEELKFAIYSKIEDVPSRLRTMDGVPMTLGQINGIVRQAEAIERDGKATNGWAVAKAHFKDTHTIRDGRWVEKAKKAASEGDDVPDEELDTAAVWTTAFINGLPNSSFAVIEGDYLSGKTDNKSCRHLPFKDGAGKVDLPHLRNALARMNQIKAVSGPESAAQLQSKAKAKLEKYRSYLKTEKEAASEGIEEMDDISPLDIKTWQDLKRIAELVRDITSDEEGGMKMPITMEQEELDAKLEKAGTDRLTAAIEAGEVISKEKADELFTQEQMDAYVAKTVMTREREKAVAALGLDEITATEYLFLAKNEEVFPLDDDGQKKFGEAVQRWTSLFKKEETTEGGNGSGEGDDKRQASLGTGANFDPGAGSQAGSQANPAKIKRYGER